MRANLLSSFTYKPIQGVLYVFYKVCGGTGVTQTEWAGLPVAKQRYGAIE